MNENQSNLTMKWLRVLVYVAIASLANSVLNLLPFVPSGVTTWLGRGITAVMIVCMFRLVPVNERYKKAGIFQAVALGCTLLTAILSLVASVLSIIAAYQEYSAHAELVAEQDTKLSRQWNSLFIWSIVSGLLVGLGSVTAALIAALVGMDAGRITSVIVGVLSVPQIVIGLVYLSYLKRMLCCFRQAEGNDCLPEGEL